MWPRRYWAARYWASRYWVHGAGAAPSVTPGAGNLYRGDPPAGTNLFQPGATGSGSLYRGEP